MYYVFPDEIQKVAEISNPYHLGTEEKIGFVDVLIGLMRIKNMDLYVTGSNSKMLSTDILTEFRGRGDAVRVNPLSYREFSAAYEEDKRNAWRDHFTFGGMPLVLAQKTSEDMLEINNQFIAKTGTKARNLYEPLCRFGIMLFENGFL